MSEEFFGGTDSHEHDLQKVADLVRSPDSSILAEIRSKVER